MVETSIDDFWDVGRWTSFAGNLIALGGQGAGSGAGDNFAYITSGNFGPNCRVGITVAADPGAGNGILIAARLAVPAFNGYTVSVIKAAGTDTVYLRRLDAGVSNPLNSWLQEVNVGDRIAIDCTGTTIGAYYDNGGGWTLLGAVTDGTYGGAGTIGLDIVNTSARVDNLVLITPDVIVPTVDYSTHPKAFALGTRQ